MSYYTLISRTAQDYNGEWVIEFGDYDRATVEFERDDMRENEAYDGAQFRIIKTMTARQSEINQRVSEENLMLREKAFTRIMRDLCCSREEAESIWADNPAQRF
jgi:hypothetical protein